MLFQKRKIQKSGLGLPNAFSYNNNNNTIMGPKTARRYMGSAVQVCTGIEGGKTVVNNNFPPLIMIQAII